MTYRERREAKADRLREWADKRDVRADAARAAADATFSNIPFGQPMLVGHHSYKADVSRRARATANLGRSFEHSSKAQSMRARADGIDSAAAHAIYSDDSDAIDRLRERIAGLESERDAIKAYNASCRRGSPDLSLLSDHQRGGLESQARHMPDYHARIKGQCPPYMLSNLSGNIAKQRARLAQLEREAGQ